MSGFFFAYFYQNPSMIELLLFSIFSYSSSYETKPNFHFNLTSTFFSKAFSQPKSFIRDYTYQAGEADSKLISRAIALEQTKKLLLQEVGTFIETEVELKSSFSDTISHESLTESIRLISAGITETKIIEEQWDGETYYLKARIIVDPNDVRKKLLELIASKKDLKTTEDRERILREKADSALVELERLKRQLALVQAGEKSKLIKRYDEAVKSLAEKEIFEIGLEAHNRLEFETAVRLFSQVIALNKDNAFAFHARGTSYYYLTEYDSALADFSKAIAIDSNYIWFFNERALVFHMQGNFDAAIKDFNRAIELNPFNATVLYNRARSYFENGEYESAIKDNTASLALDANQAMAFNNRALCRFKQGDLERGINDLYMAASVTPLDPLIYYNLACAFSLKKNINQSLVELKKAFELGFVDFDLLERDSDLDYVRSAKNFKQLVQKYKKRK